MKIVENPQKYHSVIIYFIATIYICLFSGYNFYGQDEHINHIPGVLQFFDGKIYTKDFRMQMITTPILTKNLVHLMLFISSKLSLIPIHFVYFSAYIFIICLVFTLVHKISLELGGEWPASLFSCILLILFSDNRYFRSSAFWIINGAVTARLVSVALHLMCFYLILKRRYIFSLIIACSIFYFHIHNSVYTVLPILATIFFLKKGLKYLIKYLAICFLIMSPPLIYLRAEFNPFTQPSAHYSLKEMALFREPHHIFPRIELIIIILFLISSLVIMCYMKPKGKAIRKEVLYWISPLIAIYFAGIVFTRYLSVELVILMVCFRVDVFLRIFYFILFSIRFTDLLRQSFNKNLLSEYRWTRLAFMAFQGLFLTTIFIADPLKISIPQIGSPQNAFTDIADYARTHTPKDTLFIIPPHIPGFRLYAQRSIVADFKTFPIYRGSKIQDEWMQRMQDVCNVSTFKNTGFDVNSECEVGFRSLTPRQMQSLCKKYDADYFVAYSGAYSPAWDDLVIYKNAQFVLMRCPEMLENENDFLGKVK